MTLRVRNFCWINLFYQHSFYFEALAIYVAMGELLNYLLDTKTNERVALELYTQSWRLTSWFNSKREINSQILRKCLGFFNVPVSIIILDLHVYFPHFSFFFCCFYFHVSVIYLAKWHWIKEKKWRHEENAWQWKDGRVNVLGVPTKILLKSGY